MSWGLFWAYLLWGLGQGSIGQFGPWFAELYPVEIRSTATSTIFNLGRLVGSVAPYVVPVLAASLGSLRDAMMLGVVGAVISLLFTFFLPETVGRTFAVIEAKERDGGRVIVIAARFVPMEPIDAHRRRSNPSSRNHQRDGSSPVPGERSCRGRSSRHKVRDVSVRMLRAAPVRWSCSCTAPAACRNGCRSSMRWPSATMFGAGASRLWRLRRSVLDRPLATSRCSISISSTGSAAASI